MTHDTVLENRNGVLEEISDQSAGMILFVIVWSTV